MSGEGDPIVICGMGCRLPGEVKSPSQFWDLITSGRSAQTDVPANRFDIAKWHHPDPKRRGGIMARGGYFLSQDDEYRNFDPSFFSISSLEAASLDPQQRKLLEVVFETFESAGVTLDQVSGSQTACYVGAFTADFAKTLQRDPEDCWQYQSTGSDMTILSNRVNYVFNLKGPSLTVDTACSSSLYALHLACQGLLLHDFDAAIIAGTNIIMDVLHQATATKLGILSPTSTCHTFDESADGFGRAEGVTALYVKRMSDALANGDPIRAIIRATAVNTNGKGVGISHPGVEGQEAVIRHAYKKARLSFDETAYLECHGTGTPVGDPIEVAAAGNVFAYGRTTEKPILLSSVKSQIGHTEGASGIASVQKVVMALEKGIVPATIGITKVNPALDLKQGQVKIVQEHQLWPEGYRRAGVNSFGYGGANAHVVVDHVESYFERRGMKLPRTWTPSSKSKSNVGSQKQLLVTSAYSQPSLQKDIETLSHLSQQLSIPDLAHTLSSKRTNFHHRAFTIADPSLPSPTTAYSWSTASERPTPPRIAFVFTGQGAQYPQMGLSMLTHDRFPTFKHTFTTLQTAMDTVIPPSARASWTLSSALAAPPATSLMMTDVTWTVTLCTALQICLVDLLRSWGVQPVAVVGHSSGEAAAAYCAGLLTAEEAISTSYYRALALKRTPTARGGPGGAMMAVGLGAKDVAEYLPLGREVYVGCHNSPESVTISGKEDAIDEMERVFRKKGIFARKVKSSGFANHSPLVDGAADYFRQTFKDSLPGKREMVRKGTDEEGDGERCRMYSCITAGRVTAEDVGIEYWAQNISKPVLFDEALQELIKSETEGLGEGERVDCLVEIGPHSALAGPIRQTLKLMGLADGERMKYLGSLVRGGDGVEDMMKLAGKLWLGGYGVDLEAVNQAGPSLEGEGEEKVDGELKFIVDLPGYQWTYDQIYWSESRVSREWLWRKHPRHDLLGSRDPGGSTATTVVWRNKLCLADVPWVKDHRIGTSVLVPAAGYVMMAVEACKQCVSDSGGGETVGEAGGRYVLEDVEIVAPIRIEEKERDAVEISFELCVGDGQNKSFRIASVTMEGVWTEHATGYVSYEKEDVQPSSSSQDRKASATKQKGMRASDLYTRFQKQGLNYGPCFRTLGDVRWLDGDRAEGNINTDPSRGMMTKESQYLVHPATMDGCFQLAFAAILGQSHGQQVSYLPSAIPKMTVWSDIEEDGDDHDREKDKVEMVVEGGAKIWGLRNVESDFELARGNRVLVKGQVKFVAVEGLMGAKEAEIMAEPFQVLSWYPDVDELEGQIAEVDFVSLTSNELIETVADKGWIRCLRNMMELLVFKRPGQRVIDVGSTSEGTDAMLEAVGAKSRFPAVESFVTIDAEGRGTDLLIKGSNFADDNYEVVVSFGEQPKLLEASTARDAFDLLVLTNVSKGNSLEGLISALDISLRQDGRIIVAGPCLSNVTDLAMLENIVRNLGWQAQLVVQSRSVLLLKRKQNVPNSVHSEPEPGLWLLHDSRNHGWQDFATMAGELNIPTRSIELRDVETLPNGASVISLLEIEKPLLPDIDDHHLRHLKTLFRRASTMYWLTADDDPGMALMQGMAKTLRAEYPGLGLVCVHIERASCDLRTAARLALEIASKELESLQMIESSILLRGNRVWISRYVVDEQRNMNDLAQAKGITTEGKFEGQLKLDMRKIGQVKSFFFNEHAHGRELAPGNVRIVPTAFALSKANAMTMKGASSGQHFSHEFIGRVIEAKRDSRLQVGDNVLCLSGSMIESESVVSDSACLKCPSEGEAAKALGFAMPTLKAVVALMKVGRMREGDVVVISSEDEALKLVASRLIKHCKAKLAASIGVANIDIVMDDSGDVDVDRLEVGLTFNARVVTFKSEINRKRMESTPKSSFISESCIEVESVMQQEPALVREALDLMSRLFPSWTQGESLPPILFELKQLSKAVTTAVEAGENQRITLRCGPNATAPVHRVRKSSISFSAHGTYLLVGCLGGLGRSITTWMIEHGARRFVFLSRSGADKPEAAALIKVLRGSEHQDVVVKLVRGDVCNRADVRRAVQEAECPILGVIQASTVYNDTRFEQMTSNVWQYTTQPKVIGTRNLHLETLEQPLDFFVMTSSSIGLLGATTQTHYTAGNAFLDAMAKYRRQKGLPGTALSLGMIKDVGRFQENSDLADVLQKRGAYGISEAEFRRMMEQACFPCDKDKDNIGILDSSTLVTSLDPTRFLDFRTIPQWVLDDPRLNHIGHAVKHLQPARLSNAETGNDYISDLRAMMTSEASDRSRLTKLLQKCLVGKLSSLVLTPADKLEDSVQRPLSELGMDSIVGTELQAWLWRELKVSLDFMELFASQRSLRGFVDLIAAKLADSGK